MSELIVFEVGVRIGDKYSKLYDSQDQNDAMKYAEALKEEDLESFTIILSKHIYILVSSIPQAIYTKHLT